MKKALRRLAALSLTAALLTGSGSALTTQELGDILKNEYAGDIPRQVWSQTTVEGMLDALGDPFTHYYTPQEYAAFLDRVNGADTAEGNTYAMKDGVGWVRLDDFGHVEELEQFVRANSAARRWVLDLRGNRGGELKTAAQATGLFAGKGEMIFLRDKGGKLYSAKSDTAAATLSPSIILVGPDTASAAELFAATLRDRQKALLLGSRTYGKGVAQTAFTKDHETYSAAFADGSALLLTTALAFSEGLSSNNIMGVIPHLVVPDELSERVAALLCASAPTGGTGNYLRLHLARWRWYVDLTAASGDLEAFRALLEALPPQAELYRGAGGSDNWEPTTPAAVASTCHVSGYTPRVFPDVAGSPYADAINALKTYGIVQGDETGAFSPVAPLTRASLCALLAQAMDYPKSAAQPAFADTPAGAWYTPYVTTLSAMGVVNGYDDGLFHPDDPIPHQQFMTILARIVANTSHLSRAALEAGVPEADLAGGDFAAYDPWAVSGAWLLDGAWHAPARDIDPRAVTTREEAAFDLWSALSTMGLLPA